MNKTVKTLLIIAAAGFILFLMYAFFLQPASSGNTVVTGGLITVATGGTGENTDIIGLLAQMRRLKLDRSLFAGQLYQSLHDFGVTIAPEPYGKDDPFAEIGSDSGYSSDQAVPSAPAKKTTVRRTVPSAQ